MLLLRNFLYYTCLGFISYIYSYVIKETGIYHQMHDIIIIYLLLYIQTNNIYLKNKILEDKNELNQKIMKNIKEIYVNDVNEKYMDIIIKQLNFIICMIENNEKYKWHNNRKLSRSQGSIDFLYK
jgi:hypothetical protein